MTQSQTHQHTDSLGLTLGLGLIGLQPVEDVSPFGTTSLSWESGWPLIRTGAAFAAAAAASQGYYHPQQEQTTATQIESGIKENALFDLVSSGKLTMDALLSYPIDWLRLAQREEERRGKKRETRRCRNEPQPLRKRRRRDVEQVEVEPKNQSVVTVLATTLRRRSTFSEFLNYSPVSEDPPTIQVNVSSPTPTPESSRTTTPRHSLRRASSTPISSERTASPTDSATSSISSTSTAQTTPSPSPPPSPSNGKSIPTPEAAPTSTTLPTSSLLRRRYLKHTQSQVPTTTVSLVTTTSTATTASTTASPPQVSTTMSVAPLDIPQSLNITCPKLNVQIRVEKIAEITVPLLNGRNVGGGGTAARM